MDTATSDGYCSSDASGHHLSNVTMDDALHDLPPDLTAQKLLMLDSLFDTQADTLLQQVSVKPLPASVRDMLLNIKSVIESSHPLPPMSHADATLHCAKINVKWPWTFDLSTVNYLFGYLPPASIDVVGSFLVGGQNLGTLIKRRGAGFNIDVAVEMPASLFQPKDHLNHRYFHKRSFYLAHMAHVLTSAISAPVKFAFDRHDIRKPIIAITIPLGSKPTSPSAVIHIRPCISSTVFKFDRLGPSRNNVRPEESQDVLPPTPAYNSQILADMHMLDHLRFMHHAVTHAPHLAHAIQLLKVWCEKRALARWAFSLSYLACSLVMRDLIGRHLKPVQLFRAVVFHVANIDWAVPVVMAHGDGLVREWKGVTGIGLVDAHGSNLAWWAGIADAQLFKLEAHKAAEWASLGEFGSLFLSPQVSPIASFDHVVQIPIPTAEPAFYNPAVQLDEPSLCLFLTRAVPRLLARALTNRIELAAYIADDVACTTSQAWTVGSPPPTSALMDSETLTFGLLVHADQAARTMDIGPSPENDTIGCAAFRQVWGSKSELRRFPDGTICESVSWVGTASSRIIAAIIDHVVLRHMQVKPSYHWNQHPALKRLQGVVSTTSAKHCPKLGIDETFTHLSQLITNIDPDKIPLPVSAVLPVSPELTRTSVSHHRAPATFVVEFEASGKWPDEAEAKYHMTVLFLIAYAEELEGAKKSNITCTLVKQPLSLDILYEGYLFKMIVKSNAHALLKPEMNHAMDIANLTRVYPALGPAARLFKYFIARHLLGYQIHDHITELLVAHCFTGCKHMPYLRAPSDAMAAFVRVLQLIGTHDWVHLTLAVRTRVGAPVRSKSEMLAGNAGQHSSVEGAVAEVVIDSSAPGAGNAVVASAYARHTVELVVVKRLRSICKAALAYLVPSPKLSPCQLPLHRSLDPLFITSSDVFDMVVRLQPSIVDKYVVRGACLPTAERPGFNPVDAWINQVVQAYGGLLRVFFNDIDGAIAGVVLNPRMLVPRRFSDSLEFMRMNPRIIGSASEKGCSVVADENAGHHVMVMPNVGAIAAEIARLGHGIVLDVTIQRPEWLD